MFTPSAEWDSGRWSASRQFGSYMQWTGDYMRGVSDGSDSKISDQYSDVVPGRTQWNHTVNKLGSRLSLDIGGTISVSKLKKVETCWDFDPKTGNTQRTARQCKQD